MSDVQFHLEMLANPNLLEEVSLFECKRDLFKLRYSSRHLNDWLRDPGDQESPQEGLAEFIRDLIAMANTVRQRGKDGYIVFGIHDATKDIVGIDGQSTKTNLSPNLSQEKLNELNRRDFNEVVRDYIDPAPVIDYHVGSINNKLVSYLQILPQQTPKPYQVAKPVAEVRNPLYIGDCWLRRGESKVKLRENEKQFVYPWTTVPHITVDQWKKYLNLVEVWDEFPRANEIEGYQALYSTNDKLLEDEIETFKASSYSLLIIRGQAGCGKSVFLQHLASQAAIDLLQELDQNSETVSFENPIPIFFSLNLYSIQMSDSLDRELLNRLIGNRLLEAAAADEPEKLLRDRGKAWLIFLDALDETVLDTRHQVWGSVRRLSETYSNVKVIITTRSSENLRLPRNAIEVTVKPLSDWQIVNCLEAHFTNEQIERLFRFIFSEPELWKHLKLPLFLQIAASYLSEESSSKFTRFEESSDIENDNQINQAAQRTFSIKQIKDSVKQELSYEADYGFDDEIENFTDEEDLFENKNSFFDLKMVIFLDKVFHRLWWRNNQKKPLSIHQQSRLEETYEALGEMAVFMAERSVLRMQEARKYIREGLDWSIDLGILDKTTRDSISGITFLTLLAQTYFAAFYLSVLSQSNPEELSKVVRGSPVFWSKVLFFFEDLAYTKTSILPSYILTLKGQRTNE